MDSYPIHCVVKWIENSPQVALKHYLQMTEEHLERAVMQTTERANMVKATRGVGKTLVGAIVGANLSEAPRKYVNMREGTKLKTLGKTVFSVIIGNAQVVREGLEPPTKEL